MIKKALKYLVKGWEFLITLPFYMIGWALIGIAKGIRFILFKYYLMRKYLGWAIR